MASAAGCKKPAAGLRIFLIRSFHFTFLDSFLDSVRVLVRHFHLLSVSKISFVIGILFLFTVVGCGTKGPAVSAVSGTVLLDGEPLDGASVVFHPTSSSGLAGSGKTSADGTFGLTTFRATPGAGVVPGEYVVTIRKEEWPEFKEPEDDDPDYERKMAQVEKEMERATPTYVTPQAYGDEETSGLTATVSTGENKIVFELSSDFSGSSKK